MELYLHISTTFPVTIIPLPFRRHACRNQTSSSSLDPFCHCHSLIHSLSALMCLPISVTFPNPLFSFNVGHPFLLPLSSPEGRNS
ncbi:hypothetical protein LIER_07800 [Lithospermum erythrorhizon]|uniref:Uncharacterized protein n=1 Tax=Lithospermum erythrorhizon TaxID=34254 RepID=A0AAV3PDF6_LITER